MEDSLGESLTVWTIRIAVGCYLARVTLDIVGRGRWRYHSVAAWIWGAGADFYCAHVICAFYFVHGWSHAAAYVYTAKETAALTGVEWGGGLYFNYAFTVLWIVDAADWLLRRYQQGRTAPVVFWTVHVIFAFMMFNATIVFGPPGWKIAGAVIAIAWLLLWRRSRSAL